MNAIFAIVKKEFACFRKSGAGVFLMYALVAALWGGMFAFGGAGAPFLREFIAVIIVGGFANTVFISERLNGSLEILITSGFTRSAVLFGKMIYVVLMATAVGAACAAFSILWIFLSIIADMFFWAVADIYLLDLFDISAGFWEYDILLFVSIAFMNAASSAYFSVRMSHPRFLHFINLFATAFVLAVFGTLSLSVSLLSTSSSSLFTTCGFLLLGIVFTLLARREFAGERIVRPIIF